MSIPTPILRCKARSCSLLFGLLLWLFAAAATAAPPYRVLLVFGEIRVGPGGAALQAGIEAECKAAGVDIEVLTEYLDTDFVRDAGYPQHAAELLALKFRDHPVDAVITAGPSATRALIASGERIFPGAPALFTAVPRELLAQLAVPTDVIGVTFWFDWTATLQLLPRLHPHTRQLVVIVGSGQFDRAVFAGFPAAAKQLPSGWQLQQWSGWPMERVLEQVSRLPGDTLVVTAGLSEDGAGRIWKPHESVEQIAAASSVPVYTIASTHLGGGVVGGGMVLLEDLGRATGRLLAARLSGTPPEQVPAPAELTPHYHFDQRQLQRWKIPLDRLPRDAILHFAPPPLWPTYQREVLAALLVILLQGLALAGLLLERRRRLRADRGLHESEQRLQLAADAAGLGFWIWTVDSDELWLSVQARRMLGLDPTERTRLADALARVHEGDREMLRRAVGEALRNNGEVRAQYRVAQADGSVGFVETRGRVAECRAGEPRRVLGVNLDISRQIAAEDAIAQQRRELAHLLRVGLLGQLSGAIAHELNQPLAAILSNAEAAIGLYASGRASEAEILDILSEIAEQDQRAAQIIRRLRGLFVPGEQQRETVDLARLLFDTLGLLRTELLAHQVDVRVELPESPLQATVEVVQIQQVLLNLLLNANDAMAAQHRARQIVIRLWQDAAHAVIDVSDNGPGIAAGERARVFEPFQSSKAGGMGLGLSISRSIMQAHAGELGLHDAAGGGSLFRMRLPMNPQ